MNTSWNGNAFYIANHRSSVYSHHKGPVMRNFDVVYVCALLSATICWGNSRGVGNAGNAHVTSLIFSLHGCIAALYGMNGIMIHGINEMTQLYVYISIAFSCIVSPSHLAMTRRNGRRSMTARKGTSKWRASITRVIAYPPWMSVGGTLHTIVSQVRSLWKCAILWHNAPFLSYSLWDLWDGIIVVPASKPVSYFQLFSLVLFFLFIYLFLSEVSKQRCRWHLSQANAIQRIYWYLRLISRFYNENWFSFTEKRALVHTPRHRNLHACRVTWGIGRTPNPRIEAHILITNGRDALKLIDNHVLVKSFACREFLNKIHNIIEL